MVHRFVVVAMLALCVVGSTHAAEVIVNEYNAVDDDEFLQNGNSDPFLGRRLENGGDWFEVVVIQDHLDMRGWDFRVTRGGGLPEVFLLVLTTDLIWSDLRSGTIITVSEDIPNNVDDYQPETGDWWINVRADANALGSFITASNFKTGNDLTQISVRNTLNQVIFGPAGEGVNPLRGVGSNEVFKLEAHPSSSIIPGSCIDLFPDPDICTPSYWNDGSSSTYGQPNRWSGGQRSNGSRFKCDEIDGCTGSRCDQREE